MHEAVRALLVYLVVEAANPPQPLWVGVRVVTAALLGLGIFFLKRRTAGRLERWRSLRRRRVRIGS